MPFKIFVTLFALSASLTSLAEYNENVSRSDKIEVLGAVWWYANECKNINESGHNYIISRASDLNLSPKNWSNDDDFSSGQTTAWFLGCDRIHNILIEKELTSYLVCKKPIKGHSDFSETCSENL